MSLCSVHIEREDLPNTSAEHNRSISLHQGARVECRNWNVLSNLGCFHRLLSTIHGRTWRVGGWVSPLIYSIRQLPLMLMEKTIELADNMAVEAEPI